MITHTTKRTLLATIVTTAFALSSTEIMGCDCFSWCFGDTAETKHSKEQNRRLLNSESRGYQGPVQPLRMQADAHVATPTETLLPVASGTAQTNYKQRILDLHYPLAAQFTDFLDKEDWLAQKIFDAMSPAEYKSATQFEIVATKFRTTYKLVITIGEETETKLIKK